MDRLHDLNGATSCPSNVDGADEITEHLAMIKGGAERSPRENRRSGGEKVRCIETNRSCAVLGNSAAGRSDPMGRSYVARRW